MENIIIIVALVYAIIIWILYHQNFFVFYFNFGHGILVELVICMILGCLCAALTLICWPIPDAYIAYKTYIKAKTAGKDRAFIIFVGACAGAIVAALGIWSWIQYYPRN